MGDRKYYLKNRDRVLAKSKLYYQTHKAEKQKYRESHKEQIKQREKEYESRPTVKARRYQYNQTHKEERKLYPSLQKDFKSEYNKEYRKNHMLEHNEESKRFYKRHKDKINKKNRHWIKSNPKAWQKIVLKSQIKYLNKIGNKIGEVYHRLPYLYSNWSKIVKDLHCNKCVVCGSTENLNSHHIFHKSKYPELSLNLNNGVPLCWVHHNEVHWRLIT